MRSLNSAVSVFLIFLSLFVIWESSKLPLRGSYGPGPSLVPMALSIFLIILTIAMFIEGLKTLNKDIKVFYLKKLKKPIIVAVTFALYCVGIAVLGFTLATLLFFILVMHKLENESLRSAIIYGTGFTAFIYAMFIIWLQVPFPKGIFGNIMPF